ncbi:tetratricopeptide repeat protein [Streptomyces sp. ISL-22]|uniref:FxSxx-COOH system tetratricopeptide repeat protein n=1 Tax=unclassified Streptomyces TaxID=2593676 RepID=UPI001BEAF9BB|nr:MULTISPECIES: FxSxx-COOH system tetratricopeptide repeat protein [unclassified Streptomyces]MBT2420240.1 tetratricopeptide repeat protein [Streptomyces sp. ISL-24]MBT2433146.1 tetratricopeptide repeat protein [Streptomyces sp. ISL-22]
MTDPTDEPALSGTSWPELRDALYLAACQDAAAPYRDWSPPRSAHPAAGPGRPPRRPGTAVRRQRPEPEPEPDTEPVPRQDAGADDRAPNGAGPGTGSWPMAHHDGEDRADDPGERRQDRGADADLVFGGEHATVSALPRGGLALARALRPLRLRRPEPGARELDEEATADRIAADDLWLPVCRQPEERRLSLVLLIDNSPSMELWTSTVRELREVLAQTGAFRHISVVPFDVGAAGHVVRRQRRRPPAAAAGPDDVVLVVTDGFAQSWRNGNAAAFLSSAAGTCPTAVLSLMPQEVWEFTLPTAVRAQLDAVRAAVPNRLLRLLNTTGSGVDPGMPFRRAEAVPVPVLEMTPGSFGRWARLVAGSGRRHAAAVLLTSPRGDLGVSRQHVLPRAESAPGRAGDAVKQFLAKASPNAVALARRLAAAPLNLPVMRLIQRSLPGAEAWNLAEIMLFGLLRRTDRRIDAEDDRQVSFDFDDGVREELLGLGSRAETMSVLRQVAAHLGPRLATTIAGGERLVEWRLSAADPPVTARTRPFVRPLHSALSALSGPYLARAGRLKRLLGETDVKPPPVGMTQGDVSTTVGDRPHSPRPASNGQEIPSQETPGGSVSTASQSVPTVTRTDVPPRLWGNVPQRNRNFTGRQELLEHLNRRLSEGTTAVLPEALHGMGGVGKSQIAIEYVYRRSRDYRLIWWIPAEQTNLIVQSLIELGEQMNLRAGADRSAVPAVLEALRVGEPYSNWLLVFDNAEDPHEVRQFFPNDGPGRVLVTSRNAQWSSLANSLEVDVFAREESVALIKRRSPDIPEDAADRLADSLGDLPLAVEQAAVWLAETGMPVHQYLDLFETKYAELLQVDPPADYDLPVAAAWNVSLDRLREDHPAALQLLQVCAFFAPEPIDWDFFSAVRGVAAPTALRAALDDPIKLARAVREIGRYALARIDHRKSTIQVHRLVQRVLIEQMNSHERAEMRHCAHEILAHSDPRNPQRSSMWPRYSALLPHVRASGMVECQEGWVRELVLNEARFLLARSDYKPALEAAEEAASRWRSLLGDDHEHVLSIDQVRAEALRWLGRYTEAYEVQSELVERCRRVLGESHEATQRALSFLALVLRTRGDFYRARELDQRAYETTLREQGADDPSTLQAAHNYAVSLRLAGDLEQAYRLDEDTYQRRVEVIGDDHLQTLNTLHQLYIDLQELGRFQSALEGQEALRERAVQMLGEEHSLTVWVTRELSVTRRKIGDHAGALELSSKVLQVLRSKQGEKSLDTVRAALNHATDLRQTGDLTGAATLGRQAMLYIRELLGPEHPHAYATATNLAVTLRLLGQIEESRTLDEEAVRGLSRVLSERHPRTMLARTNLASDHFALGEVRHAHDIDAELLQQSIEARGEEHPSTLAIRLNLSYDLKGLAKTVEAKEHYEKALASFRRVLGIDHQATRDAANGIRANCDIDALSI